MSIDELIENFAYLDNWEDKYRYLIDLGNSLPPMPNEYKTEAFKVEGCQSQVWLKPEKDGEILTFLADSDAIIVKGLIFVVLTIFAHCTAKQIKDIDIEDIFAKLNLKEHLSPSRRNGLNALVEKIKGYAQ